MRFSKLAAIILALGVGDSAFSAEPRDIREFVIETFRVKIDAIKSGIYCQALSCNFEVESFFITETDPKTYVLSASGWLEGTIPALRGSARRAMGLTGSYTQGTCVVQDLKPVFDNTTNNNGWGASRIEGVFKRIVIPKAVVLTPDDCSRVEKFIFAAS
jgi:hypothetical protein